MIDFRYHVVSLVSVFLALAVGIALGAGPLKEPLGSALSEQVTSLARQKAGLRSDLSAAESAVQRRDQFVTAVTPALAAHQLGGRSVVLVTLPGVDTGSLDSLTQTLQAAGATVSGEVNVQEKWTEGDATALHQVATQLQDALPGGSSLSGTTSQVLADLLARAVVTADGSAASVEDTAGQAVLQGLKDAELINAKGDFTERATSALVIAPPVAPKTPGAKPSVPDAAQQAATAYLDIASALDSASSGTVVLGPASAAGDGGIIAAVRGDDAMAQRVSTVDTGGTPMGDLAAVLALRQQLRGASGSYGFAAGAEDPLPAPDPTGGP